jgi:PAS domain S-box-containing protein
VSASGGLLSDRTRLPRFPSVLAARVRALLRSLAAARHSMGARLLIAVVLFSGSVTLILTAIQVSIDYRRDVSAIDYRLTQISNSDLDSLAQGLWTRDEQRLQLNLQQILVRPDISAVEVREAGTADDGFVVRLGGKSESSAIAREYALRYKGQGQDRVVGTLRVEATLADVYRRLVANVLPILAAQATQTFLVCLFVLYILRYLVMRHLRAIATDLRSHRIGDSPLQLRLRRSPPRREDELERVITAFNALSYNLHIAYRDLHERDARIQRLVDANIIGIFLWDFDGRILEANDAFLRMVGYDREDLVSGRLRWTDLTPPEWHERDAQWVEEHKRTGLRRPIEKDYFRKDGSRVPILLGAATFGESESQGVAFVLDLTERKRAEEALRESERRYREVQMELAHANRVATMGQLTASIVHEVSQPIAGAGASGHAALRWLANEPPDLAAARRAIERMIRDINRAGDVIGRIRALVKKTLPQKHALEINGAILEVIALTRGEMVKNGVSLRTDLAEGLPLIHGDRVQLQQVILNLVINAIEAMSGITEASRELLIRTESDAAGGVLVTVRDSGPGLAPGTLERLFEAFYTTKPDGLGMGLSICHSIIEAHRGRLSAAANMPRGAIFHFTVPAHPGSAS